MPGNSWDPVDRSIRKTTNANVSRFAGQTGTLDSLPYALTGPPAGMGSGAQSHPPCQIQHGLNGALGRRREPRRNDRHVDSTCLRNRADETRAAALDRGRGPLVISSGSERPHAASLTMCGSGLRPAVEGPLVVSTRRRSVTLYVGLDVHRRRTQVSVMDEDGHELFNRNVPKDPERLGEMLCGAEPGTPVVFKAAYGWGWLAELIDEMGFEAHMARARGCKAIAHARLKNDRVDARRLAHLLRADLLPEAWIAPRAVKELRMILRHRAALVRQRTVFKTRVRAVLADRGIDAPAAPWDGPGRRWLTQIELPAVEREVVDDLRGVLDAMDVPITRLERRIRELAKPDPRVEALQHLPGVGLLTAMTLVAEIGDISRFSDARKLCAWSGMTPKVRNSDATVHHGRMTKQGPAAARCALGSVPGFLAMRICADPRRRDRRRFTKAAPGRCRSRAALAVPVTMMMPGESSVD